MVHGEVKTLNSKDHNLTLNTVDVGDQWRDNSVNSNAVDINTIRMSWSQIIAKVRSHLSCSYKHRLFESNTSSIL